MRSLRVRLLVAVGSVVVAALALVGYYSSLAARLELVSVEEVREIADDGSVETTREVIRDEPLAAFHRTLLAGVVLVGGLALLAAALLAGRILRPIRELTQAAGRMAGGDLRQRVPVSSRDEIGELARRFNAMADALERTEASRRQLVHDVAHELRTPLTAARCQLEAILDEVLAPETETLASVHE